MDLSRAVGVDFARGVEDVAQKVHLGSHVANDHPWRHRTKT
jgi:hypothetical protein